MHLSRKISLKLDSWIKSNKRKPLILRGARQVGKTASVRELAKRHNIDLCEVNFERQPELKRAFQKTLDPISIVAELEVYTGQFIHPKQTLLFFDEIQECPEAITSLRYFYEEQPDYCVIAAGSLLEFALQETSVPVGRVSYEYMYPMCFSEFLDALGQAQLIPFLPHLSDYISMSKEKKIKPVPGAVHTELRKALTKYFIVGGMPEVVTEYVQTKSFAAASKIQSMLLQTFRDDTRKYTTGNLQIENVSDVFTKIFKFTGKQIKYTEVGESSDSNTSRRTKKSLQLLEQAMLVKSVRSSNPTGIPLGAEASEKHIKYIFIDIGLGQSSCGLRVKDILTSENLLSTYRGMLAEQFVGQQLLVESLSASEDRELYCWIRPSRGSSAELDYLIVREGKIIPIEVKSGKSGRLKSLNMFLDTYGGKGICLQDIDKVNTVGNITFMPLYTIL